MRAHAHVPPSAIGLIVGAVLCFTILDATVKVLADRYPIPLLVWARYTVQTLVILLWLLPKMGVGLFRTPRLDLQLVRGAILPLSSLCFFSALKYLPLAEATAINYGTPILVIILAVVFLGERMTRPRIALVLAGIAGMFLIVRPGSVVFQGAALLALGSAVFYGAFQILTRMLAGEDSRVLLFYPAHRRHGDDDRAPAMARHRVRDAVGGRRVHRRGGPARNGRPFPLHPRVPAGAGLRVDAVHVHAARLGDDRSAGSYSAIFPMRGRSPAWR